MGIISRKTQYFLVYFGQFVTIVGVNIPISPQPDQPDAILSDIIHIGQLVPFRKSDVFYFEVPLKVWEKVTVAKNNRPYVHSFLNINVKIIVRSIQDELFNKVLEKTTKPKQELPGHTLFHPFLKQLDLFSRKRRSFILKGHEIFIVRR